VTHASALDKTEPELFADRGLSFAIKVVIASRSRSASGARSPGPSRCKALTYFGSGNAFASLEKADGFVDGSALLGYQDVGVLGYKVREEFKNSSTFLWAPISAALQGFVPRSSC